MAVSDIQFLQNTLKKKKLVFYKYYKDLLNKEKLDAVFVTLPNYLASTVTKECIKRKLHVFCKRAALICLRGQQIQKMSPRRL